MSNSITKSLWKQITTAGTDTPASTDLVIFAPLPGTDLVTECAKATVAALVAGGISGDYVKGPASAVAGGIPLFDGTTGKLLKDSDGITEVAFDPILKVAGGTKSSDGSPGISTTIDTAGLVGKTITVKDGLITGFA